MAGSWYFGNNPAAAPMYDPATGVTFDGVSVDGVINRNSGAESTIHGLLSMLALDAAPDVAAQARVAQPVARHTWRLLEAEAATLAGGAAVVTPASTWTGESGWSGAYVTLPPGGSVAFAAQGEPGLVQPVALRSADRSGGSTRWGPLGILSHTDAGPQGVVGDPRRARGADAEPPGHRRVHRHAGLEGHHRARRGALPAAARVARAERRRGHGQALVRSFAPDRRTATIAVPGTGRARATSYDATGREVAQASSNGPQVSISIPSGGFALAVR